MAVKEMTPVKGKLNKLTEFAFEAATKASDGFLVKMPRGADQYVVVLVHNSGTEDAKFTFKKPENGSYYAACRDEVYEVPAGAYAIFRFENAKWANRDGTMCFVPEKTAVKAAVLY